MRTLLALFPLLALLIAGPAVTQAQDTEIQIGPRVGYDLGDMDELFIGVDARIDIADFPVKINPTFDYYFTPENVSFLSFGANALYPFELDEQEFMPYVGAGLGLMRSSVSIPGVGSVSSSEVGINLIGGAEYDAGNFTPFGQAGLNVGSGFTVFGITVGLLFNI